MRKQMENSDIHANTFLNSVSYIFNPIIKIQYSQLNRKNFRKYKTSHICMQLCDKIKNVSNINKKIKKSSKKSTGTFLNNIL